MTDYDFIIMDLDYVPDNDSKKKSYNVDVLQYLFNWAHVLGQ